MFCRPVLDLLHAAGWHEGRKVPLPPIDPSLELFPTAEEVLVEFGGLHVGKSGPGIDCATSDVNFDLSRVDDLGPELKELGIRTGLRLFPLGDECHSHGAFVIDEKGETYVLSLISDDFWWEGVTFADGLERLLLGLAPDGPVWHQHE